MSCYSYDESQPRLSKIFLLDTCAYTCTNTHVHVYTEIQRRILVFDAKNPIINVMVLGKKDSPVMNHMIIRIIL